MYIKDPESDHRYYSENLCGESRSSIIEIKSSEVVMCVDQYREDLQVPFEGAYVIAKADMESGKSAVDDS